MVLKWLQWAIVFHIAEFCLYLFDIRISFALEIYSSTNENKGRDENV